jgi:hypothetical protein
MDAPPRRYRAGDKLDDLCRACKLVREHAVMVAGPEGEPIRVVCGYCGSLHNYRGGGPARTRPAADLRGRGEPVPQPIDVVSERERSGPVMSVTDDTAAGGDLEMLLRRIIREEAGVTPVSPAEKWRGGEVVLRPGKPGLQEKTLPIESLFHKVVMIRNRLRVLEQQINGSDLPGDVKLKLQGYVTACYGSLTTFNVLFAEEEDRFRGSGGRE